MYADLLVPHDGSALSDSALAHALDLAHALRARVRVLHVITDFASDAGFGQPELAETAREACQQRAIMEAEQILARARARATERGVPADSRYLFAVDPHQAIVEEVARLGCDLIVMASHGRRGIDALLLGSETRKVLTHCRTPVLVVRP
ncbi:MAG: universal stress protein [Xanthomonadales bacterium]|nr:TRAP-T-associated universal stress protein TeaD [Xanthomonadales bacterium]MCC6594647.1 universal stress protein [Xanthomonadales bacterium]MCE7932264.1 universal stress protein [Xanthomonadales bacterium PRO6]